MRRTLVSSATVAGIGAAIAGATLLARFLARRGPGSQTNASEAMDDVHLRSRPSPEEVVDAGVQSTFPASDPPSVEKAFETAYEREQQGPGSPQASEPAAPPRSPDWMLQR